MPSPEKQPASKSTPEKPTATKPSGAPMAASAKDAIARMNASAVDCSNEAAVAHETRSKLIEELETERESVKNLTEENEELIAENKALHEQVKLNEELKASASSGSCPLCKTMQSQIDAMSDTLNSEKGDRASTNAENARLMQRMREFREAVTRAAKELDRVARAM